MRPRAFRSASTGLTSRVWRIISIVVITAALTLATQAAIASQSANEGPGGEDIIVTRNGGGIVQVRKISNNQASQRAATTWAILTRTAIVIPTSDPASFFDMRFSGESVCFGGGNDGAWCSLRILVNGVEANPVAGTDFAFDSTNVGRETAQSWESHAIERYSNCLPPGQHVISVEWTSVDFNGAPPTFRLDDWTLAIERVRGCQ